MPAVLESCPFCSQGVVLNVCDQGHYGSSEICKNCGGTGKTTVIWGKHEFDVGHRVKKIGGDYSFEGNVVAIFKKRTGAVRIVVEDDRGLLFIFNQKGLEHAG